MQWKYAIIDLLAKLVRIIVTLTRPITDTLLDYVSALFIGKTRSLPPIESEILLMPATELAKKIRKRQLSCEEVMRAYVERSKLIHPCINAVVDERYDDAMKDARNIDRFLASNAKSYEDIAKETPLLGLPFSCKEAIGVKGMSQTSGLPSAKGRKAKEDSASAAMYRKAGAIPVTVTNVPQLCMWWDTYNHLYGLTRNPYDNLRTVGGSSGGEGSLITSAGALFGIGNDLGGSIRVPSAFCGIYGHKPSRGIISNFGSYPFSHMKSKDDQTDQFWSTGPMCRYVQDIPLLLKVLSDNDNRLHLDEKVNFKKVKVYYMEQIPGILHSATPEVKNAVKKAVKYFEEAYDIQAMRLHIDELKYGLHIWECKMMENGSPSLMTYFPEKGGKIALWWELIKNLFHCSDFTLPIIYFSMTGLQEKNDFYYKCLQMYKIIEKRMDEIFRDDSILIMPTHPEPPPHYLMTIPKFPNVACTCIFNLLGLPVTQITAGLSSKGLPIGIQAISGQFKDHLTLATAMELDKVFGGWISPCPVKV